jgi:hypothetical protein
MTYSILVLYTGNSARSILGEALFQRHGANRVVAFMALPFETLDRGALKAKLDAIGAMQDVV